MNTNIYDTSDLREYNIKKCWPKKYGNQEHVQVNSEKFYKK